MIMNYIYLLIGLTITTVLTLNHFGNKTPIQQTFYDQQPLPLPNTMPPATFEDASTLLGIEHQHKHRAKKIAGIDQSLGSGVCALDINNDSWIDLLFVGGMGNTRHFDKAAWWHKSTGHKLYLNNQGTFQDISKESGLNQLSHGMGCIAADFNNDGFTDIYITNKGSNHLYKNNGNKTFEFIELNNKNANQWSTSAVFFDINQDGFIDIYTGNYIKYTRDQLTFEDNFGFMQQQKPEFSVSLYDPESNELLINKGNMSFEEKTQEWSLAQSSGRTLAIHLTDINNDQKLDIIDINDDGFPSQINLKGKHGYKINDRNNKTTLSPGHDITEITLEKKPILAISRSTAKGFLILNKNSLNTKQEVPRKDYSWKKSINSSQNIALNRWAVISGDFNNDGLVDIFSANGLLKPDIDAPKLTSGQYNTLYTNNQTHFIEQHLNFRRLSSRGAISVDINNDGKLDIVTSNNNDSPEILLNTSLAGSWVNFSFTRPIQTLRLKQGKHTELQQFSNKFSFLSQSDPRYHFGLPSSNEKLSISYDTLDGKTYQINNITPNQFYLIEKSNAKAIIHRPFKNLVYNKYRHLKNTPSEMEKFTQSFSLSPTNTQAGLAIALLNHSKDKNFINIVKGLEKLELEDSAHYLINHLRKTKSATESCALYQLFETWFKEEEAVIERKNLAIRSIINNLKSSSGDKKICASKALAEAENIRSILPLLDNLSASTETEKLALYKSIGKTKQKHAIDTLYKELKKTQNPQIYSEILLALQRLSNVTNSDILKENLTKDPVFTIEVLYYLLKNEDRILFPVKEIKALATNTLNKYFNNSPLTNIAIKKSIKLALISKYNIDSSILEELKISAREEDEAYISTYQLIHKETKQPNKLINNKTLNILRAEKIAYQLDSSKLSTAKLLSLSGKNLPYIINNSRLTSLPKLLDNLHTTKPSLLINFCRNTNYKTTKTSFNLSNIDALNVYLSCAKIDKESLNSIKNFKQLDISANSLKQLKINLYQLYKIDRVLSRRITLYLTENSPLKEEIKQQIIVFSGIYDEIIYKLKLEQHINISDKMLNMILSDIELVDQPHAKMSKLLSTAHQGNQTVN